MTPQQNAPIALQTPLQTPRTTSPQWSTPAQLSSPWPPSEATDTVSDTLSGSIADAGPDSTLFGMPGDRQVRIAARRAFVALKQSFLYVMHGLVGQAELQLRVQRAEEPHELWALRAPVFAALAGGDRQHRSRRQLLNRSLETMFPSAAPRLN